MSECKFKGGDWVKCIKFDGATGKRLLTWKGLDGIYQVTDAMSPYLYLDGQPVSDMTGAYENRFVLVDAPHNPMDCDSLEDILAEQELYAKLEAER